MPVPLKAINAFGCPGWKCWLRGVPNTVLEVAASISAWEAADWSPVLVPERFDPEIVLVTLRLLCIVTAPAMFASPPTHRALVTPKPPAVLKEPVEIEVESRVPGMATLAVAPVPPRVSKVVAPAQAVKVVLPVVMLVVVAGEVNVHVPRAVAAPLA